jgi:ABC-type branched-subunit amino acid transport system permease subunit
LSLVASAVSTILLDGFAYAMVLFLISAGLSLTMGLMGFANLAHTAFAMAGGYVSALLVSRLGVPFVATLPIAFVLVAVVSVAFERLLYRPLYRAPELDQVLMTFGLVLMTVSIATYIAGPLPPTIKIPSYLSGRVDLGFRDFPTYRLFLIAVGVVLSILLWAGLDRTRFGASIRAAVDNRKMAYSVGINVDRLFMIAFALGSGIAALGGALGNELLPLTPTYALEYLVIILIVVAVGGMGSLKGTFVAALVIGILDTAGKYLLPQTGGFTIYIVTLAVLLVRPSGLFGRPAAPASAPAPAHAQKPPSAERWRIADGVPWVIGLAAFFLLDRNLSLGTQILVAILFALSLDLVMGYAGILTIGQAAFFGVGGYASGMLSAHLGVSDPLLGLLAGAVLGACVGFLSGWVVLRTQGLALLMLTLAVTQMLHEGAAKAIWLTGGHDGLQGVQRGPLFGVIAFDFPGKTMYLYALAVLFLAFLFARRLTHSQFGLSLHGIRENASRMMAIGSAVHLRRVVVYTIAAALAGVAGALSSQAIRLSSLDMINFERSAIVLVMLVLGGVGNLYGAFLGAAVYMTFENYVAKANPQYWYFWVGLFLILRTLYLPRGLYGLCVDGVRRLRALVPAAAAK